jgi:hypothetical protein
MTNSRLEVLEFAQEALRSRWNDFRGAFERRDTEAYRVALADFLDQLRRWTAAEERALLPALGRNPIPGRDTQRELRLEFVQLRELARFLLEQATASAPIADVLGLAENLDRRLTAHEREMGAVYFPAACGILDDREWLVLRESAPTR